MKAEDELRLILRCRSGDRLAYGKLVETYKRQAYYVAYGLVGNKEDALDMVQEAFIKAYRNLKRFDPKYRFSTWYFRILTNTCISHLRKRREYPSGSGEEVYQAQSMAGAATRGNPHAALERKEAARWIRKALGKLKDHLREVVVLKDVQGFTYAEIAQITGVPIGTVMSRLHSARSQLRELLLPVKACLR
ncbi:RNA polymerase sigma factor [Acidobacteriota bacterium]